jgi:DNA modification methylase
MRCLELGFHALPLVLWRKPTNAPTKFMGSGMLPVGAYVTLEHEYILILRKGGLRRFDTRDKRLNRARSALFWEERNRWYSDIWDFRGVRQELDGGGERGRSAAFPFELAYRLVNMYSVRGEYVFDPFLGTGTTLFAAMSACRNSIGLEVDRSFESIISARSKTAVVGMNNYLALRLQAHMRFIEEHQQKPFRYRNINYGFPVMTRQERELLIHFVQKIDMPAPDYLCATYSEEAVTVP